IVHPALFHFAESLEDHLKRLFVSGRYVIAHQKIVNAGTREFGSAAESSQARVEDAAETLKSAVENFRARILPAAFWRAQAGILAKLLDDSRAGLLHACAVVAPGFGQPLEHRPKTGASIAVIRRKIGSAEKRLALRRQPYGHRPSPAARRRLNEQH